MVLSELRLNLTVVIPTRNRTEQVQRLVKDIKRLDCEVIVVDDHSQKPFVIDEARVIRNPQKLGVGESRNIGCRQAKGEWLLLLDDDVVPSPGFTSFIREFLPKLKTKEVVGFRIVGFNTMGSRRVIAETSHTKISRMLNILFGVDISFHSGPSRFVPAPAMLFHSDFYASLGGCDSRTYGGNAFRLSSDLQWRARMMGGRRIFIADAFFEHLNLPVCHQKGHSENDSYFMRNQTIFSLRSGGLASFVMIAAFGAYMVVKGFRPSILVKGVAQGLGAILRDRPSI